MDRLELALIALGGFAGATLRYAVSVATPGAGGTLAVNVLGSFALGMFIISVSSHRAQLFFGAGLSSSFTTYSTFAVQTASLSSVGGAFNVGANYALGFAAAALDLTFGGWRRLPRCSRPSSSASAGWVT